MRECTNCGVEVDRDSIFCEDCASAVASDIDPTPGTTHIDRRRDFLQFSIDYLQRRLDFVNNKANIFIAIQTGLFITIIWLLGSFFLPTTQRGPTVETIALFLFLLVNFIFVIAVVALLLQTVRPSATYLSLFTDIDTLDTSGVMWPSSTVPEPDVFIDRVDSLSEENINRELVGTIYALQQLVDRTYKSYRWAVLLMKIQVIVVPLGFLMLAYIGYF